tara:strand:- start:1270 stop:1377 length:108 start_codon:yes stop_codon:yes gene_type:complete
MIGILDMLLKEMAKNKKEKKLENDVTNMEKSKSNK